MTTYIPDLVHAFQYKKVAVLNSFYWPTIDLIGLVHAL
jgi:hypothetical protein